ncbi:MAG: carboxypeptidase regulatory-like domain-containing protein [Methylococcales bacterium]|jgi:hypothetical protein|nr:carboxypeptidase regulatory-like domain-containing protein [Methylococcales bacterium]MBT7409146.1 carboxypeptidase regulatory-like domain-containing protein [Methylococcales bacterium]
MNSINISSFLGNLKFNAITGIGFAVLLATPVSLIQAGNLSIDVATENYGQGLANASVCLGTNASPTIYGARLSNKKGRATFADVPNGKLLVTVSKDGYRGHSRSFNKGQGSSVYVPLRQGGGGATCTQAVVKQDNSGSRTKQQTSRFLQLSSLKINRSASSTRSQSVSLNHISSGSPTQYRASEKRDFSDAKWEDYSATPSYTLSSGKGMKTVFFQVRKVVKMSKGEITRDSVVVSDGIRLY